MTVDAVEKLVTVKLFFGWDSGHIIMLVENAWAVECTGGSAVAVHERIRVQVYEEESRLNAV